MSKLHTFIPLLSVGKLVVVPTHGDWKLDAKMLGQQICQILIALKVYSLFCRSFTIEALCCKLVYSRQRLAVTK